MDYTQIKSYISNFDTSPVGIARMQMKPIKRTQIDSVSEIYGAKPKFKWCGSCGKKSHTADVCWKDRSELMPKCIQDRTMITPREVDEKSSLSGSRAEFSFAENKQQLAETLSVLYEDDDEWALSLHQGSPDDIMIFVDSCAIQLLFLLGDSAEIKIYQKSSKSLGTVE